MLGNLTLMYIFQAYIAGASSYYGLYVAYQGDSNPLCSQMGYIQYMAAILRLTDYMLQTISGLFFSDLNTQLYFPGFYVVAISLF